MVTKVDREALKRAIETAKAEDASRRRQIEAKLAEEPWLEVAEFAAYVCQSRSLSLRPWETPPCLASPDPVDERPGSGNRAAWALAQRLEAAGLSRFEPDPISALAALRLVSSDEPGPPAA